MAASVLRCADDPVADEEDFAAAAAATFILLLGAHARGLGGYWRTPARAAHARGPRRARHPRRRARARPVHLGHAKGPEKLAPERAPVDEFRSYLA